MNTKILLCCTSAIIICTLANSYGELSFVWANTGEDKVTQDELRGSNDFLSVKNMAWNGDSIFLFGAKNEVVNCNLILESSQNKTENIDIIFPFLKHSNGYSLKNKSVSNNNFFVWTERHIELFYIKYLEIKGISRLGYESYDERHIPKRFRRPWTDQGIGSGTWNDRPDHNKYYPDIAVPLELETPFSIAPSKNQSIWIDIFIPKTCPHGTLRGSITIRENGQITKIIPVVLTVYNFTLPDVPSAKSMAALECADINERFTGTAYPNGNTPEDSLGRMVQDNYYKMAHRHKISLIDENGGGTTWNKNEPRPYWVSILDGSLFSESQGYDGPGINQGSDVFCIGIYGSWIYLWNSNETDFHTHCDAWEAWFQSHAPSVERFVYLIDESSNYAQIEKWAAWMASNTGIGKNIMSFATVQAPNALENIPSLDYVSSPSVFGAFDPWKKAIDYYVENPDKKIQFYNGGRPATGTFLIEDDGVALRQIGWTQFKSKVDRWFYWAVSYYNNYQGGTGHTNLFTSAFTFGGKNDEISEVFGETGWNYNNGDGVLMYPGSDKKYPDESYGINGPISSLRLKFWRRGIQDVDYLTLAEQIDAQRVKEIVDSTIPKVLWEYGVADLNDPTWVRTDISWSTDPDEWEKRRKQLAELIVNNTPVSTPFKKGTHKKTINYTVHTSYGHSMPFLLDNNSKNLMISVLDMKGRCISNQIITNKSTNNSNIMLRTTHLSTGMYFIRLKGNKYNICTRKMLIVER